MASFDPPSENNSYEESPSNLVISSTTHKDGEESSTTVTTEVNQEKVGNYVLTIGKTNSGKTSIQRHLAQWLLESDAREAHTKVNFLGDSYDSQALIERWKEKWGERRFSARTDAADVVEICFEVTPYDRKLSPVIFTFMEIAGEKFHNSSFINGEPEIPDDVIELFENDDTNISLVLVCDGESPDASKSGKYGERPQCDTMFFNFLSILSNRYPERYKNIPVMLIVSKWDIVKEGKKQGYTFSNFITKNIKATNQFLLPKENNMYYMKMPFSVGNVRTTKTKDGKKESEITQPNFFDVKILYRWIYMTITGYRPIKVKPNIIKRFFNFLTNTFGV